MSLIMLYFMQISKIKWYIHASLLPSLSEAFLFLQPKNAMMQYASLAFRFSSSLVVFSFSSSLVVFPGSSSSSLLFEPLSI